MSIIEGARSQVVRYLQKWLLAGQLRREWRQRRERRRNERPVEYAFALRHMAGLYPEKVLDVGTGGTSWPHLLAGCGFEVTALDEIEHYWGRRYFNRHYHVLHEDICRPQLQDTFDFITCLSVIEHIEDHDAAVAGMFRLLAKHGYMVLSFPYNERRYVHNVYELPEAGYGKGAAYICQVFSRVEIEKWMAANGGHIVEQEYYEVFTGELWSVGQRIHPVRPANAEQQHHLSCLLIQKT